MKSVTLRSLAIAALAGLWILPGSVRAHAEFESGTPADGATVGTGPIDIVATFSEELAPKSHMELLDANGAVVARAAIDGNQMRIGLEGLQPGTYEIKWTSVAEDNDVERNTNEPWTFSVAETSPSSSSAAPSSAEASVPPTLAPSPSLAPSAAPTTRTSSSSTDILLPILAAVIVTALLGGWLLRRRSTVGR
jgi:methionine-rich copper-binding protein CopC